MTRRADGHGATFDEALQDALATLLEVTPAEVAVKIEAPGIAGVGPVRLDLDVVVPAEDDEVTTDDDPIEVRRPRATAASDEVVDDEPAELTAEDLDEEAEVAADFLEGLLDALDLPGDIRIRVADDHAEVEVVDIGSGALIGRRGQTLEAIQELVRCTLQREFQRRSRIKIDAEGYRARRLEKLVEKAEEAIDEVLDTGEPVRLEPMDVFERKAVHQIVADAGGVTSRSQGREPARRVVIEQD